MKEQEENNSIYYAVHTLLQWLCINNPHNIIYAYCAYQKSCDNEEMDSF